MSDYVITTDSNSDVPAAFLAAYPLTIIPQYYAFGDTVYGDELNMPPAEFYETMRKGELPKSMANNPAVIREKFTAILKEGKDILHIAFSSALSGSCSNVQVAANELMEEFPGRKILVFDSLNASLGEGLSVMRAVELKDSGAGMQTVYDTLMEERDHINVSFTVDDLHHLQRGGRVSKTTAVLGGMLNIKPVLHVDDEGKLIPVGKVRGRKKSILELVSLMDQKIGSYKDTCDTIFISHGDCKEDAEFLSAKIKEKYQIKTEIINHVGATIGAHSGPGTLALFFLSDVR